MKKHTLENGTVLEVGKEYRGVKWSEKEYWKINTIGKAGVEFTTCGGETFYYSFETCNDADLIPYQEPPKKDLEGLTAYVEVNYSTHIKTAPLTASTSECVLESVSFLGWLKEKPKMEIGVFNKGIITLSEALDRGLPIPFEFKK